MLDMLDIPHEINESFGKASLEWISIQKYEELRGLESCHKLSPTEEQLIHGLMSEYESVTDENMEPVFFFRAEEIPYGIFCQWYKSSFKDENGQVFRNAEQYMMYHKAITFKDASVANQILRTPDPRKAKALGRSVKNFDIAVWDAIKVSVVERGSYLKYTAGIGRDAEELRNKLLNTGNRDLVEASKFDPIWGVGFTEAQCRESWCTPDLWGKNLLGKALVTVRTKIKDEEDARAREPKNEPAGPYIARPH